MNVELLYFERCPHYASFARHLEELLASRGVSEPATQTEVRDAEHAIQLRFLGSPSVRINGSDIDESSIDRSDFGMQCRLYATPTGFQGTPPDELLVEAIRCAMLGE
jgi:hypothetical protein